MFKLPKAVQNLIEAFERLPGIGPKTAARLTFYLWRFPQKELEDFAQKLVNLKSQTVTCSHCFNVGEQDPCGICRDPGRDPGIICVVEEPLDVLALEKTGKFLGLYHVLGGAINPLQNIGPDELYISQLIERIKRSSELREVILATNPTMEGEATAMYITKKVRELKVHPSTGGLNLPPAARLAFGGKITRLARGLPVGGDLEYADEVTLTRALEGRREY